MDGGRDYFVLLCRHRISPLQVLPSVHIFVVARVRMRQLRLVTISSNCVVAVTGPASSNNERMTRGGGVEYDNNSNSTGRQATAPDDGLNMQDVNIRRPENYYTRLTTLANPGLQRLPSTLLLVWTRL